MRLGQNFLRSRVARRIFSLFVACAMMPILAISLVSSTLVTQQVSDRAQERLQQSTETIATQLLGRLHEMESQIRILSLVLETGTAFRDNPQLRSLVDHLRPRVSDLVLVTADGADSLLIQGTRSLAGVDLSGFRLGTTRSAHLSVAEDAEGRFRFLLGSMTHVPEVGPAYLVAEIRPEYLWDIDRDTDLSAESQLFVLDAEHRMLFNSIASPTDLPRGAIEDMTGSMWGAFEWTFGGENHLGQYRWLNLNTPYGNQGWTVVLTEPEAVAMAPLTALKKTFPLLILICLLVVSLLSVSQIRKSLIPIDRLGAGTRRIADGDFDARVEVDTDDEFRELADSFNAMAVRLGAQFKTLSTLAEFDKAILSTLKEKQILDIVLRRLPDRMDAQRVAMTLADSERPDTVLTHSRWAGEGTEGVLLKSGLSLEERQRMFANPGADSLRWDELPAHLREVFGPQHTGFLLLPLCRKGLVGCLTVGFDAPRDRHREEIVEARRLADEISMALSNARLVEQLEQATWETLYALARTVDANSPWTAGHSERVTAMTLRLAKRLGLPEEDLVTLHKGGLLHDLGKVGVPTEVLDKAEALTDEEMELMRSHVRIGARILEPISAYRDEIPIVLYHHENFDGSGYPDGLAGEEIPLHARILAVADVFDSLASDRPYRAAWDPDRVIEFICNRAGTRFDPDVVAVFREMLDEEGLEEPAEEETALVPVDAPDAASGSPEPPPGLASSTSACGKAALHTAST